MKHRIYSRAEIITGFLATGVIIAALIAALYLYSNSATYNNPVTHHRRFNR